VAARVTLFVTATGLGPAVRPHIDSFGQTFDVADHRRLYRFRRTEDDGVVYRPGEGEAAASWWQPDLRDDFDGLDAETALVTAARASASFPIAFTPVREGPELARRRILPAAPSSGRTTGGWWMAAFSTTLPSSRCSTPSAAVPSPDRCGGCLFT
jgi:hypothetical protein